MTAIIFIVMLLLLYVFYYIIHYNILTIHFNKYTCLFMQLSNQPITYQQNSAKNPVYMSRASVNAHIMLESERRKGHQNLWNFDYCMDVDTLSSIVCE